MTLGHLEKTIDEDLFVDALVSFLSVESQSVLQESNYLRFSLFGELFIVKERLIIQLVFFFALLSAGLLLFRVIFPFASIGGQAFYSDRFLRSDVIMADSKFSDVHTGMAAVIKQRKKLTNKYLAGRRLLRVLPLFEAILVAGMCFASLLLGRFLLNSLTGLAEHFSGQTVLKNPRVLFYFRLGFYICFFFMLYGLLDSFKLIPHLRRSAALQAGALLLLANSLVLGIIAFQYSIFFLIPALFILTAGLFRPISLIALALVLIPLIVIGRELYLYYSEHVLLAVINPTALIALYLAFLASPFILWAGSLLSRRDHFQRGSNTLVLMSCMTFAFLLAEFSYVIFLIMRNG